MPEELKPENTHAEENRTPAEEDAIDTPSIEIKTDDALEGKNALYVRVYKMTEEQWKNVQRIAGIICGLLSAAFLFVFRSSGDSAFSANFLIAVAIALLVPRIAEKQLNRSVSYGQRVMLLVLGGALVIYSIYILISGTPLTVSK